MHLYGLVGTNLASEPFIPYNSNMMYDLLIVFSSPSLTVPLEMVALTTKRIYLMTC